VLRRLLLSLVLFGLFPPAACAGVSVGHSSWEWSNPLPQGNSIRALDFAGNRGYAAGSFGTLLATTDAGYGWTGLATGVTDDLTEVQALDIDSVVVAGGCAVRRSDDDGSTFRRLPWTASESRCRVPIVSLAFPSPGSGYLMLEDGRFYRSASGGRRWERMGDLPGSVRDGGKAAAMELAFTAADSGFATTSEGLYRTHDGGASWTLVSSQPGGLYDVFFFDSSNGYAVGDGVVLKTVDGGERWLVVTPLLASKLEARSVRCSSPLDCLVTVQGGDRIVRTIDGGLTWSSVNVGAGRAQAIGIATQERAVAAGSAGAFAVSSDSGASWVSMGGGVGGGFTRLAGASGSRAFAVGRAGRLAATSDGGQSWRYLAAPSNQDVLDVSFADDLTGFALDGAGGLFRTDDAGQSWRQLDSGNVAFPQSVLALDAERVLLIGTRGIRRSSDGGLSFRAVRRPVVRRAGLFGIDYASGRLVAYGPRAIFSSVNGGKSWRKLARPDHRPLGSVDFVSSRRGFALGKGGRLWRTRNGGRSWRELLSAGTDGPMALAFSNARDGYLVASDLFFAEGSDRPDYLLRTTNAGQSWRPQLVVNSRDVNGLLATRQGTDFLLAGSDQLFDTSSGGDRGRRSSLTLRTARRHLAAAKRITVSGRLSPAEGGERVVMSKTNLNPHSRKGGTDWTFKSVRVRSSGSFKATWKVRRSSVFVAQWTGDDERMSAGSRVLTVTVKKR
jgi:photosystem II stability/assembly factor-like uncharacterized protein